MLLARHMSISAIEKDHVLRAQDSTASPAWTPSNTPIFELHIMIFEQEQQDYCYLIYRCGGLHGLGDLGFRVQGSRGSGLM